MTKPHTHTIDQPERSERRIIGRMLMQAWGGRKGDDAIFVREEEFDATDAVLGLSYAGLQALGSAGDGSDPADSIGQECVHWDGPFEVHVIDSICAYFGVSSIEDITQEQFAAAKSSREAAAPSPAESFAHAAQKIRAALTQGRAAHDLRALLHESGVEMLCERAIARLRAERNVHQIVGRVVAQAVPVDDDTAVDDDVVIHASETESDGIPDGFWVSSWSYVSLRDVLQCGDVPEGDRRAVFLQIAKERIPREALLKLLGPGCGFGRDPGESDEAFIDGALAQLFDGDDLDPILDFKPADKVSERPKS